MSAPPKSVSDWATSDSPDKGGFHLRPRTKIWLLAGCLVLMVAASVYSVLQSLNPDPMDLTLSAKIWYPRETNPNARLQLVRCANDYACRLNSVAVNGAGELPEVWAVGNVGLVLHRPAGQTGWEQLTVRATENISSLPPATPTPTPAPVRSVTRTPPPALRDTPTPTPTPRASGAVPPPSNLQLSGSSGAPLVAVPDLVGLGEDEARKTAAAFRLSLQVEYEKGSEPNPTAQQAPPRLKVVRQSPAPSTPVPSNSTITITLGTPRSGASLLLDRLVPTVYAAEPDKAPGKTPSGSSSTPKKNPSQRPQGRPAPAQGGLTPAQVQSALAPARGARRIPLVISPLDDDLIYVNCEKECTALGRSGRLYKMSGTTEWNFSQTSFPEFKNDPATAFTPLLAIDLNSVIGKSGEAVYRCGASTRAQYQYLCDPDPTGLKASSDNLLYRNVASGQTQEFFAYKLTRGINLFPGSSGRIDQPDASGSTTSTKSIPSGTTATLRSYSFASDRYGLIVGDHGTILSSADGGNTWRHETQGLEGAAPNHRLPALWYWALAFLLIVASAVVVAAPLPRAPSEISVADWTVTDAPLKPGDVDSLNFTPMALGLSRFIRNPKTQPPVTIAIEGEWGEGKSSVMSLLRGDLEKSRFRPVWFNAWHHQSEEQLLAALLEHIKDQAIPPWWHIDNWIFRTRLLHYRFRRKWPLLILLVLALFGSVAFELSRHGLKMDDFVNFGKDVIKLIKYLLPWSTEKALPDDLGHFSLVATLIAIFAAIFKKAQAFGINPAKLTDNLRDAAAIKDVKPDPGIRPRFAREFADVCKAWSWGGRRVIIFIDDLDRCRPESVVTVLEYINFLTTAGDCMIVLGMAQSQVTHCVGLGFKEIAQAEADYDGKAGTAQAQAIARFKYGELYIKKLVNIVAPLPKTSPEQRRRVLEIRAAEVRHADEEAQKSAAGPWRTSVWDWASQAGRMIFRVAPVIALMSAVALSVFIGYKQGAIENNPGGEKPPGSTANTAPATPTPTPQAEDNSSAAKPLVYARPTTERAELKPPDNSAGGVWWSFAIDALFLLVLFGVLAYQLSARTNQDAQNSPEFEESLQLWGQYIVGVCDTPREIKRALNDLRYQAMTRRTNGPSTTRAERLLRALRQFVTGRAEKMPAEARVDESALPPLKAAEFASLTAEELKTFLDPDKLDMKGSENLQRLMELKREHLRHFRRWIGDTKSAQAPSAAIGPDDAAAQAAHQA
jgi:hypothetical protein